MAQTPNANKGPTAQYVPVSVAQGLETKVDPNLVTPPKALQADNVRLTTLGAVRKRFGMQLLPTSGSGAVQVGSTARQLVSLTGGSLQAYDNVDAVWSSPGSGLNNARATSLSTLPLATHSSVGISNASVAFIGDIGIYCYDDSPITSPFCVVMVCFDVNSGEKFWTKYIGTGAPQRNAGPAGYYKLNSGSTAAPTDSSFNGCFDSQITAFGNQFILSFRACWSASSGTNNYLRVFSFSPSRTVVPNPYNGANCTQLDNYAFPTYWAQGGSSYSSYVYSPPFFYSQGRNLTDWALVVNGANSSDTTSQLVTAVTNSQPITQSSSFTKVTTTISGIVTGQPSPVAVSLSDGLPVAFIALKKNAYTVATVTGGLTGYSSPITWPSNALNVPFDVRVKAVTGSATNYTYTASDGYGVVTGTGSGLGAIAANRSIVAPYMVSVGIQAATQPNYLASRIVTYNGDPCAWVNFGFLPSFNTTPASEPSLLFVDLVTSEVLGRAFYLQTAVSGGSRPATAFLLNGNPTALLLSTAQDASDNLEFAKLVTIGAKQPQIIRTPDGAIITGADTKYYDNQIVRSAGWLKIPEIDYPAISNITGTTGGGLTPGNQYIYFLVLADFDAAGNIILSSPSQPYTVTLTGSQNAVQLSLSEVYPAFLGSSTGPILYVYRNSYLDPLNYHLANTFYMEYGQNKNTWTDTSNDADFNSAPKLYAPPGQGQEQPNDPAPPSNCGVATKTRVFLAGGERPSALYFSKPFFAGRAPEFYYGNVLDIEPATGPIIGLGSLDDVVVIFKSSSIYLLNGQGPDATGSGTFNAITNISTDRGLVDSNSIALSNDGLYFRSQRGIELLDRSYNLDYVGQAVESLLAGNTVVSAISVPKESQVRFALSDGTVLVYDYTAQGWTRYIYALNSVSGTPITGSQTVFNNVAYSAVNGATSGSGIYQESMGFLDETNLFPLTFQTAHIPLAGQLGWGRVRRCNVYGVTKSVPSRISVQFVYDYGAVTSPPIVCDISTVGPFSIRVRAPRQVAEAVSVIVQNLTSSGIGEGSYITGIVFETSQKSGALRASDAQSV